MNKILKTLLYISVFYSSTTYAECDFRSEVIPLEKAEKVKKIYLEVCEWFLKTFEAEYENDIVLQKVIFVDSWDDLKEEKEIENKDALLGFFEHPVKRFENAIYVLSNWGENAVFKDMEVVKDSFIFHELIHFFIKKTSFEELSTNKFNMPMNEALAYWSQNQYLLKKTGLSLIDYINEPLEDFKVSRIFPSVAMLLYKGFYRRFLYNAVLFFDTDRIEKYQKVVTGEYRNISMMQLFPRRD